MRPSLQFILICTVFNASVPCADPVRPNHLRSTERFQTIPPYYNLSGTFQLSLILLGLFLLVCSICVSNLKVRYLPYDTNLSTLSKSLSRSKTPPPFYVILLILLVSINSYHINLAMLFHFNFDLYPLFANLFKFRRRFSRTCPFFLSLTLLTVSVSPVCHLLCLPILFVTCSLISRKVPVWVSLLLVLLSNDIEMNPGPGHSYRENFFTFMNWNLNSLSKDNFQRVQAIEAHNSLFNYDLISVCETSLNSSIEIPDPLLNDYNFLPANHPDDVTHGGCGIIL